MIKPKIGICVDCGPDSKPQPLIAGRCQSKHYWQYRQKVNSGKASNVANQVQKKENTVFFASQILQTPRHCENCGELLAQTIAVLGHRAVVAHIVPKRAVGGCPSVATHPKNRWFGCGDCHTNFDRKGNDYVLTMPVLSIVRERFELFKNEIAESEQKNIPAYLL